MKVIKQVRPSEMVSGLRIMAPNCKRGGGQYSGEIVDVLDVMVYVQFDCGTYDFIFKAQNITLEGA